MNPATPDEIDDIIAGLLADTGPPLMICTVHNRIIPAGSLPIHPRTLTKLAMSTNPTLADGARRELARRGLPVPDPDARNIYTVDAAWRGSPGFGTRDEGPPPPN